jgi:hypothetical protein
VPDSVGSVEAALNPPGGPVAATGEPLGAAGIRSADSGLAWQTTVGQIVFFESVIEGARPDARRFVRRGRKLDGAQRRLPR